MVCKHDPMLRDGRHAQSKAGGNLTKQTPLPPHRCRPAPSTSAGCRPGSVSAAAARAARHVPRAPSARGRHASQTTQGAWRLPVWLRKPAVLRCVQAVDSSSGMVRVSAKAGRCGLVVPSSCPAWQRHRGVGAHASKPMPGAPPARRPLCQPCPARHASPSLLPPASTSGQLPVPPMHSALLWLWAGSNRAPQN